MSETTEINNDSGEKKKHIGMVLVEEGHILRNQGRENIALELETVGRLMIEEVREEETEDEVNFGDTLYDVK